MTDIRILRTIHAAVATAKRKSQSNPQSFAQFTAEQNAANEYRLSEILKAWRDLHLGWQRAA
jgi:hypothetical protein